MSDWKQDDPFEVLVLEPEAGDFSELTRRPVAPVMTPSIDAGAATARLHGFDLDDRPLVTGIPGLAHEILAARTTVALLRRDVGADVVLLFDRGDARRPIVVGVLQSAAIQQGATVPAPLVSAQVDDQKVVLTAEREIVLKCGEASITLTRAGKVLIKGTYVLSRSSGYNKIKGAAVDIN
jgi:hypothetical protein